MSIGGGSQKSGTKQSSSSWDYGTDVWGGQSPYLQDLYARAQAGLGNMSGDAAAGAQFGAATGALDRSQAALQGFLNPQMDPSVQAYAQNLGQQFNEQFLPGLKGDAALAGGLGGSRQQIGAALGGQRAMQTLGDFTAQVYSGQQDRALQAAQQMGQNAQGYTALADFGRSMPWYGLNQYAGLLGAPVMRDLGGYSTSKGKSSSSGWNASFGLGGG